MSWVHLSLEAALIRIRTSSVQQDGVHPSSVTSNYLLKHKCGAIRDANTNAEQSQDALRAKDMTCSGT